MFYPSFVEMEPVNLERKKYVNTQLDELDSQIKITAKKRKHYPRLCKEHLHRKYKYENACLVSECFKDR